MYPLFKSISKKFFNDNMIRDKEKIILKKKKKK